MAVRLAGIDQHLGAIGPPLGLELAGIEPGRPGVAQGVDVLGRVAARAQRPHHLVEVGRVDVVVHGDDPLGVVGRGRALGGEREHLRGVPGILLLQRDHHDAPARRGGRMGVGRDHAGHPDALEIIEDAGGAHDGVIGADLAGRIFRHQRRGEDRCAPVMQRLHLDHRLRRALAPVIAGELAERAFRPRRSPGSARPRSPARHGPGSAGARIPPRVSSMPRPMIPPATASSDSLAPKACAASMNSTGSMP